MRKLKNGVSGTKNQAWKMRPLLLLLNNLKL
jgi:hypothetical protein